MSQTTFLFYAINFRRKGNGPWVFAQGDIANNTLKSYQKAVFQLSVFDKERLIWKGIVKIPGFRKGQTRRFELLLEGFRADLLGAVEKYEICFDGGY